MIEEVDLFGPLLASVIPVLSGVQDALSSRVDEPERSVNDDREDQSARLALLPRDGDADLAVRGATVREELARDVEDELLPRERRSSEERSDPPDRGTDGRAILTPPGCEPRRGGANGGTRRAHRCQERVDPRGAGSPRGEPGRPSPRRTGSEHGRARARSTEPPRSARRRSPRAAEPRGALGSSARSRTRSGSELGTRTGARAVSAPERSPERPTDDEPREDRDQEDEPPSD